jgi:hypothetical protein
MRQKAHQWLQGCNCVTSAEKRVDILALAGEVKRLLGESEAVVLPR